MRGDSDVLRRVGIFAITLMVVTSMVAPTAMAATSQTNTTPDEDPCNPGLLDTQGLYSLLGIKTEDCANQQSQQMAGNLTHADSYASSLAQSDLRDAGLYPIKNHLGDSKTYARTLAKTEAVKLFNNGTSKSQIKASVNDSIESYYVTFQQNSLSTYGSNVNQTYYNLEAAEQVYPFADPSYFYKSAERTLSYPDTGAYSGGALDPAASGIDSAQWELRNETITLLDGSNETIPVLFRYKDGDGDDNYTTSETLFVTSNPDFESATVPFTGARKIGFDVYLAPPNNTLTGSGAENADALTPQNSSRMFSKQQYVQTFNSTEDTAAAMKNEASQFIDLLFTNYNQTDGVPISEVLNPNDLTSQWNTNYNTTGYYGWIAATLGLTGLEGNVNSSFSINYTPRVNHTDNGNYSLNGSGSHDYAYVSGESYNVSGTLMTDWDPNPNQTYAFERGATYDTANADAPVLFVEQVNSTESRVVRLNGTFTIGTITNVQTGETINSTSLEEQNQQTWNSSSSVTELTKLIEYRNKSVTINEAGGGGTGGSGGFNFDFGTAGIGFIVIAGGAALLLTRS